MTPSDSEMAFPIGASTFFRRLRPKTRGTLRQGDGDAGPAWAGGVESGARNLIVLDADTRD
jgi:hypothetical protein